MALTVASIQRAITHAPADLCKLHTSLETHAAVSRSHANSVKLQCTTQEAWDGAKAVLDSAAGVCAAMSADASTEDRDVAENARDVAEDAWHKAGRANLRAENMRKRSLVRVYKSPADAREKINKLEKIIVQLNRHMVKAAIAEDHQAKKQRV